MVNSANRASAVNHVRAGFTLIEVLIYTVIFGISAVFFVMILVTVTRTQLRQSSVNEVGQQLSFVASTLQRLVRDSSAVEIDSGSATSTLVLRMASSSADRTFVYVSGGALRLEQGASATGSATAVFLTNEKVKVSNFSVTKYENPGGLSVVQFDLTVEASTTSAQAAVTRVWRGAVGRVTAATFDSSILPNTNNSYDVGNSSYGWRDVYIGRSVGLGVSPPGTTGFKSAGDLSFSTSSVGLVLMKPDGNCVRITVNSSGNIATSSAFACP